MLRDGRLTDAEPVDQLADRPFTVSKQIENLQPARFAEDLEGSRGSHCPASIAAGLYAWQGIKDGGVRWPDDDEVDPARSSSDRPRDRRSPERRARCLGGLPALRCRRTIGAGVIRR